MNEQLRKVLSLAERAIPFLRDEGQKYDDDGSNEPLELAGEIEEALASSTSVESTLGPANLVFDGVLEAAHQTTSNVREEWQTIDSAPKDGTKIDLWDEAGFRRPDCRWDYHYWENGRPIAGKGWGRSSIDGPAPRPTHWMPIPAPPSD